MLRRQWLRDVGGGGGRRKDGGGWGEETCCVGPKECQGAGRGVMNNMGVEVYRGEEGGGVKSVADVWVGVVGGAWAAGGCAVGPVSGKCGVEGGNEKCGTRGEDRDW